MNRLYEVVAFRPSTPLPAGQSGAALQIASDRWLFVDQRPDLTADFAITDVTGKWREVHLTSAARLLATDVHALLAGRDCARTALFDCPAILTRHCVWIESSYEHAFNVALQQASAL